MELKELLDMVHMDHKEIYAPKKERHQDLLASEKTGMMTLVVGGGASGKSEYAESLVLASPYQRRVYIATMEPFDEECLRRIEKHRRLRAEKRFETLECYTDLASVCVSPDSVVLLECMSNLCANEMYSPHGSGNRAAEAILRGVEHLRDQCGDLVVVSNEVFAGGRYYAEGTMAYLRQLAQINRAMAAMADNVCEVACGIPVYYKGEKLVE